MPDDQASSTFTEKLVAYLDGELPDGAAREVEHALSSDPTVRAEAEKLSRVWELLDLLPRPNASGAFSARTMSTLKAGMVPATADGSELAATELIGVAGRRRIVLRWLAWTAGLLLVAALGFLSGRRNREASVDPLLDDLSVIENLNLLQEIGDEDFLRELQRKGLMHERATRESR